VHPLSFCGSRINLYTVNIQYTDRPLKAFIYKEKYGKISIENKSNKGGILTMLSADIMEIAKQKKAEYMKQYREAHKEELRAYNLEYQKKYRQSEKGKQAIKEAQLRYWYKKAVQSGAVAE
jgi:hypothetical protein